MITIRREHPEDAEGIRLVNEEEFGRPEEAFMVMPLREGALDGRGGSVRYLPEFSAL